MIPREISDARALWSSPAEESLAGLAAIVGLVVLLLGLAFLVPYLRSWGKKLPREEAFRRQHAMALVGIGAVIICVPVLVALTVREFGA